MRLRFPRTARLTRSSEFAQVRAKGRALHGKAMVVSVWKDAPPTLTPTLFLTPSPNPSPSPACDGAPALPPSAPPPPRIGFITSRRVGNAVTRNRARRRLRELLRADRPYLVEGCWIVIIAKPPAATLPFSALQNEWRSLAKRAGVLVLDF